MKNVYTLFLGVLLVTISISSSGQNFALQFMEGPTDLYKNTVTAFGVDLNGNTTISLEAWVNIDNFRVGSPIIFKENGTNCVAKFIAFYFFVDETGHLGLGLGNGTEFTVATSTNTLGLNEWHHVAATWDGSLIRLYIDGVADGTMPAVGALYDDGLELNIGNRWNCLRRSYEGTIDEVKIWKDVRTEAEINANMLRELPYPQLENDLILYYNFNEGSGTITYDQSANGFDGQLGGVTFPASTSNAPTWVNSGVPFFTCPTVEIVGDDMVYYGYNPYACANLSAEVIDGVAPYTYEWSNGDTGQSIEVCPDETTLYTVIVTDANDCSTTAEFLVEVIDVRCGWGGNKVLICHTSFWWPSFQYTICVHKFFVPWLLYFGDQLGSCDNYKASPLIEGIPEFETEEELQQFDQMMFEQFKLSNPGLIEEQFNVYPNPVNSFATVSFTTLKNEYASVEVYDLMGKRISNLFNDKTEAGQQYQVIFDASKYQSGTYLLLLKQGNSVKRQKITIK